MAFNSSIEGRLIAPRPAGWVCHDPNYDETACKSIKAGWNDSVWRADQPGAMMNIFWGNTESSIDAPRNVACEQGFIPIYSVNAHNENYVSEAVKFAGQHNLRLVLNIRGTTFLIVQVGKALLASGLTTSRESTLRIPLSVLVAQVTKLQSAVTVGAAELWIGGYLRVACYWKVADWRTPHVYKAAKEHNATVVGGAAPSVGAAGGWVQGGGHSPISGFYGLGVDNALQFKLVKPDGQVVTANKCQNQDLFWALRGGGGSTWGIVLDVTYKTYPPLKSSVVAMGINTTDSDKLSELSEVFLRALPEITDQGWPPRIWSSSLEFTNSTLQPIYDWVRANNGTQIQLTTSTHSTYYDMFSTYIGNGCAEAAPFWFGTRLVSRNDLATKSEELVEFIFGDGTSQAVSFNLIGGGAISKVDPESTGLNPQWRRDALLSWRVITAWTVNSSAEEIKQLQSNVTKAPDLGKITDLETLTKQTRLSPNGKVLFWVALRPLARDQAED
ncbi:unnamed protein product [Rhizoctonia solani]|uniref:FAD-binding PCMH-type domain-containing protein n=1 Tax=Rhizoctonia solani TaxID=456999 RepID=A0A8H3AYE3_9AGAM|nr:unnamed protein product [Rhizoctonia solani]